MVRRGPLTARMRVNERRAPELERRFVIASAISRRCLAVPVGRDGLPQGLNALQPRRRRHPATSDLGRHCRPAGHYRSGRTPSGAARWGVLPLGGLVAPADQGRRGKEASSRSGTPSAWTLHILVSLGPRRQRSGLRPRGVAGAARAGGALGIAVALACWKLWPPHPPEEAAAAGEAETEQRDSAPE